MTNRKTSKLVFLLSLIVFIYWVLVSYIVTDVYKVAVVGALFELFWLPMIIGLAVLPIISLIQLVKERFNVRSFSLYSFFLSIGAIIIMFLR